MGIDIAGHGRDPRQKGNRTAPGMGREIMAGAQDVILASERVEKRAPDLCGAHLHASLELDRLRNSEWECSVMRSRALVGAAGLGFSSSHRPGKRDNGSPNLALAERRTKTQRQGQRWWATGQWGRPLTTSGTRRVCDGGGRWPEIRSDGYVGIQAAKHAGGNGG